MAPVIAISIVTFNSRDEIARCLDCVWAQTEPSFAVSVWDNASVDGTSEFLRNLAHPNLSVHLSDVNVGFCVAHNRMIRETHSEFVLVLNPDCYLEPDYLDRALQAARADAQIGAVTGKLFRLQSPKESFEEARKRAILDSTGTYFTPAFRHFDRGSNEEEEGRFQRREWVFGVTGAAGFYRRAMLEEIRIEQEYFDEDFFAYREDADLAWRMQSAGWKCLFVPEARGYHVRKILPRDRSNVAATLNMHSVKNRFLFRLNNVAWQTWMRFFIPLLVRDCAVLGYVLLVEHGSLPGLGYVLRHFPRRWQRRKRLLKARKVPLSQLHRWIHWRPTSFPAAE